MGVDYREQLKTFKRENHIVCLGIFDESLWAEVLLAYRFPEQVAGDNLQIRDDKGYSHSRGDGQRWQEHLSSFCCVLGIGLFMLPHVCSEAVHNCTAPHTRTEHTTGRLGDENGSSSALKCYRWD